MPTGIMMQSRGNSHVIYPLSSLAQNYVAVVPDGLLDLTRRSFSVPAFASPTILQRTYSLTPVGPLSFMPLSFNNLHN